MSLVSLPLPTSSWVRREDDPIEVDDDEDLRVMIEGWEMFVDGIRLAVMMVSLHLMFAN